MTDEMIEGVDYEKQVSAKIYTNPEFKIPETTPQEVMVSTVGEIRGCIYELVENILENGASATKAVKFTVSAIADIPFTAIDIGMSYKQEGLMQATITAVAATGATIVIGAAIATAFPVMTTTIAGVLTLGVICGITNYGLGKLFDGIYDLAEEEIMYLKYNEESKTAILNTNLTDMNDINSILDPIYQCSIEDSDSLNQLLLNQNVNGVEDTYIIKPGDTVWALAQRYGLTPEEMVELNPWLGERFSPDGSYALIRPGEHLLIPGGKSPIAQKLGDTFTEAEEVTVPRDPLLIDLDGDGIETTTVENGVYFDHESDGFADWCKNVPRICHG